MEDKNQHNTNSQQGSKSESKRIPKNRIRRKKGGCGCGKKKK